MAGPRIDATVSVHDEATAALNRIMREAQNAARAFERLGGPGSGVGKHFDAANRALDMHMRQLERAQSHYARMAEATKRLASNVAIMAAPSIIHGSEKALHLGAERVAEQFRLGLAGIHGKELESARALAQHLQTQLPILDQTSLLERYKEIRSIVPRPEEASHVLPIVARTEAAMKASDPTGQSAAGLQWLMKAAEIAGFGQNTERLERYFDAAVRAQQVLGKTIDAAQLADFVKKSGTAAPLFHDRFLHLIAPGLVQELGGETAGFGIRQMVKLITSNLKGPTAHPALEEFRRLGLVKNADIEFSGKGKAVGLLPGHFMEGHKLAATDPASWVWTVLLPALRSHGVNGKEDQILAAQRLFPNSNAARIVEMMINQEDTLKRHMGLFEKAAGTQGALDSMGKNPLAQAQALNTALGDLAATLTSPAMEPAARIMRGLASGVASFGETLGKFQKDNPALATALAAAPVATAGVAGYKLYQVGAGVLDALKGGASLNAAGVSLQAAAVELRLAAAASKLPGLNIPTAAAIGGAAEGAGVAGAAGAAARGAGLLARFMTPQGLAIAATTIVVGSVAKLMIEEARSFDRAQEEKRRGPRASAYDESRQAEYDRAAREQYLRALTIWSPREIDPRGQGQFNRFFGGSELIRAAAFDGARNGAAFGLNSKLSGKGYGASPFTREGGFPALGDHHDRPKWPGIIPHESSWAVPREISVQGTVQGEAHVSVENHVRVDASPQFLASIERRFADASARMQLSGKLGTTMQGGGNSPARSGGGGGAPVAAPLSSNFGFGAHGTR
ncbi:hypothetical protein [Methylocystis suflitae]|uniref:hypothetical protein n=1 Tax=Methylocystis suflitae TaxID=2951405 RepID=UPI00210BCF81|nr:hypothetical protein [Methylocystis suflitae]MCQ4189936.1 hypothetical protein [Methylocystis suflitae]